MTTEKINMFNAFMNFLFLQRCVTIREFNSTAKKYGYNDPEISQFLQHLLKSKQFVRYEGKLFASKSILTLNASISRHKSRNYYDFAATIRERTT